MAALVLPTSTVPRLRLDADIVELADCPAGAGVGTGVLKVPKPRNCTVCGVRILLDALSRKLIDPVTSPDTIGVKARLTTQLPLAPRIAPSQVSVAPMANGPVIVSAGDPITSGMLDWLVTVTFSEPLVTPTVSVPKSILEGKIVGTSGVCPP